MSFIHLEGKRLLWCYLGSATQAAVRHTRLDQRIIGSAQDRLGGLERFDLAGTCLFSHLEVLQQPVTFAMQRLNVLLSGHQGLASGGFLLGMRIERCLSLCLGFALVCQGLCVNGTLLCGVLHGALVIFLSVFLSCLALSHLFCQVRNHSVDQGDDTAAFPRFLGESLSSRRWWGWGNVLLDEANAGAGNATWRGCGCQGATTGQSCPVRIGQLALWRSFVELRIIELVQAVLCEAENFFGSTIRGHQFRELGVFLFALLSCFSHRFVKCNHACLECLDLVGKSGNEFRLLADGGFQVAHGPLETLLLVIGLVELCLAVLFFAIVIN